MTHEWLKMHSPAQRAHDNLDTILSGDAVLAEAICIVLNCVARMRRPSPIVDEALERLRTATR